jgi:hypothetical protein
MLECMGLLACDPNELSMDELRGGCTCALCRSRRMTNGEILADSINRQFDIIRGIDPQA